MQSFTIIGKKEKIAPHRGRFSMSNREYESLKNRVASVGNRIATYNSNKERAGTDAKPTLRKFSWQDGFATEANLDVIAGLASLCKRGNMYDRIGNSAFQS